MTDRGLMQEALSVLEKSLGHTWGAQKKINEIKNKLRERLAQLKSEPIKNRHVSYVCPNCHWSLDKRGWVGLTDEEAIDIEKKSFVKRWAIIQTEAKLKEKNT